MTELLAAIDAVLAGLVAVLAALGMTPAQAVVALVSSAVSMDLYEKITDRSVGEE